MSSLFSHVADVIVVVALVTYICVVMSSGVLLCVVVASGGSCVFGVVALFDRIYDRLVKTHSFNSANAPLDT